MSDAWRQLVERIHRAPHAAVIVVTGGGASAIAELLSVPGGSRTVLEAVVPYCEAALIDWLGRRPDQFCDEETALAMAAVAHQRAQELTPAAGTASSRAEDMATGAPRALLGVSCTASLVSNRPKKGDHRCHVATQSGAATSAYTLILEKGARNRQEEERLVGRLLLHALSRGMDLEDLPPLDLRPGESVVERTARAEPLLVALLEGRRGVVWSLPEFQRESKIERASSEPGSAASCSRFSFHASIPIPQSAPAGLLCGAFHPRHFGHEQLRAAAENKLGAPVYYEMSILNVDKPPLDFLSIERRRAQFPDKPLALTAAPTFAEKALVLPGVTFVIGVDTAERIVQPRYYGGSAEAMRASLAKVRAAGCQFLVAGREVDRTFMTLDDVDVPSEFAELFSPLSADEFRADISSTELRRKERPESSPPAADRQ